TVEEATEKSFTYPDHTYVHIVNEFGQLDAVFISISGNLIPVRLDLENSIPAQTITRPITTLPIPQRKCSILLQCSQLHLFALGPNVRKYCSQNRQNFCTKLSDFDDLCNRAAEKQRLLGFYRAFISSSTQWLSKLFDGVCIHAKIINMQVG
ncbi:unnamed protein product, partial [Didymodactylos carnosus]